MFADHACCHIGSPSMLSLSPKRLDIGQLRIVGPVGDAAWHEDLVKRIIEAQPLAQDALARLQQQRGEAVRAALLKAGPVQAAQVALEQPAQSGELKDGEVQTRLELAAVKQ